MPGSARDQLLPKTRSLVLDRQDRSLYIGIHPECEVVFGHGADFTGTRTG